MHRSEFSVVGPGIQQRTFQMNVVFYLATYSNSNSVPLGLISQAKQCTLHIMHIEFR